MQDSGELYFACEDVEAQSMRREKDHFSRLQKVTL